MLVSRRPVRHVPTPPSPRRHAASAPTNQKSDEHDKETAPAYEGALFDTRGYCIEHPWVQLREKKGDDTWRVRRRLCASCLQVNNHKMFIENRRSKPCRAHGSASHTRSTVSSRDSGASGVPHAVSIRGKSIERSSTSTWRKPTKLEAKLQRNGREEESKEMALISSRTTRSSPIARGRSRDRKSTVMRKETKSQSDSSDNSMTRKTLNAGTIRRSDKIPLPQRNDDKVLLVSRHRPSNRSLSRTPGGSLDPSAQDNQSRRRSRSVSRRLDSITAPIKRSVSKTRECIIALKQPAEDLENSRSRALQAPSLGRRRSRSRGKERPNKTTAKDQGFELESNHDRRRSEKPKGHQPLTDRANAYSESAMCSIKKDRSRCRTPLAHRAEAGQKANTKSLFSRQLGK